MGSAPNPEIAKEIVEEYQRRSLYIFCAANQNGTTVIEQLLPVELLQKEEKRDPSTTLVVIIDTSGSMAGVSIRQARNALQMALRRLKPEDTFNVIQFNDSAQKLFASAVDASPEPFHLLENRSRRCVEECVEIVAGTGMRFAQGLDR